MKNNLDSRSRRMFISKTAMLVGAVSSLSLLPKLGFATESGADEMNIIGPKEGYSPQIGTLVSMMTWMRATVLRSVEKLKQPELDFLFDPNSNTIGAMLMHLAATESFYQINTFQDVPFNKFAKEDVAKWGVPMNLGEPARKAIKGNDLIYYTNMLQEVRSRTLEEFRNRDDQWLMKIDPHFFGKEPTNNYCKWFHVCEHESNHNGQIKWIDKRLPGAKADGE